MSDWGRDLDARVRKLRVQSTSDPDRLDEFADALLQLTAVRLQSWDFGQAATDAPEAVITSARVLAAGGPVGPYAKPVDAARYHTSSVQLATIQALLGATEGAARTLAGLDDWQQQLGELSTIEGLAPETLVWNLIARAQAASNEESASGYAELAGAVRQLLALTPNQAIWVHLTLAADHWRHGRQELALAQDQLSLAELARLLDDLTEPVRPGITEVLTRIAQTVFPAVARRAVAASEPALGAALSRQWRDLLLRLGQDPGPAEELLAATAPGLPDVAALPRDAQQPGAEPAKTATQVPASLDLTRGRSLAAQAEAWGRSELRRRVDQARLDQERLERESRAEAERREAEAAAQERLATERQAQQAALEAELRRHEAEAWAARQQEQRQAARLAAQVRRQELAAERHPEVDPELLAASEPALARLRAALNDTPTDDPGRSAKLQVIAGVLRPLAGNEERRAELVEVLTELVALHWRAGQNEASRNAARELRRLQELPDQ